MSPFATLDPVTTLDLRTLRIRSGEQWRDTREIELDPFDLGGRRYSPVPDRPEGEIAITRTSSGQLFELDVDVKLVGPCVRCLTDTELDVHVDGREYQATNPGESDELRTPYLDDDRLDLSAWTRDAVALELPEKILCREDCAGLCPVCGRDLNREPHEHVETESDPRWAALAELRDRL